ncbi:MAG: right-handed parallel beta-helix repeat-containing protein [Myxococcales bacterium]|nr:right-handed parallel beta-helix repeat-containing protein [Myxococcales bacterium]
MRSFVLTLAALAATVATSACKSSDEPAQAPDGVTCSSVVAVGDGAWAQRELANATPGTCVVLKGGPATPAAISVPKGVTFAAGKGERPVFTGASEEPVVTLAEGAQLVGIQIQTSKGVGVAVRGPRAKVRDVSITGAGSAAVAVLCSPACVEPADATVELTQVKLSQSQMGLWVSGAHVSWTSGESRDHASTGLAVAAGVVAQDGARVDLTGVVVARNQGVGILLDGEATGGVLKDVQVTENSERGLWAQRLKGTLDKPSLRIEGSSVFSKNRIVGVGGLEARGIIFVGGRVQDTQASPTVTNLGQTEQVGDGIGLFGQSGDVKLENVDLSGNARAAALVDNGTRGIIFVGGRVQTTGEQLKVVVQNTSETVTVDAANVSKLEKPIGVNAPKLPTATILK